MWFCYLDEAGNTGKNLNDRQQPLHVVAAVMVREEHVMSLAEAVRCLLDQTPTTPRQSELHGADLYGGRGGWAVLSHDERNALYFNALGLLEAHACAVAHSTIDKPKLKAKGYADPVSPHLLAMQFLLEKIDRWIPSNERALVVADENKEHEFDAIELVSDMQQWGSAIGPGRKLKRIIDTVHFVRSKDNQGVQMADLVAYVIKRSQLIPRVATEPQDVFIKSLMNGPIDKVCRTWRNPWPC